MPHSLQRGSTTVCLVLTIDVYDHGYIDQIIIAFKGRDSISREGGGLPGTHEHSQIQIGSLRGPCKHNLNHTLCLT